MESNKVEPSLSNRAGMTPDAFPLESGEFYCGYATDAAVRERAASGGVVSGLLRYVLEQGEVDVALVSRLTSVDGHLRPVTEEATALADVLAAAGSSYVYAPVLSAFRRARGRAARFAVVALPCQARMIRRALSRDEVPAGHCPLIIGLFCRGALAPRFYDDFARRKGFDPGRIRTVHTRRGHLGGATTFETTEGESHEVAFFEMNAYRIAGVDIHRPCLWCAEHLSACADIAVGDIFVAGYEKQSIRRSCVVPRTEVGVALLERAVAAEALRLEPFGRQRYQEVFRRIERHGHDLASRRLPAKLTGVKLPHASPERGRPPRILSWLVVFACYRAARSSVGRQLFFALPSFVIKGIAFTVRGLARL